MKNGSSPHGAGPVFWPGARHCWLGPTAISAWPARADGAARSSRPWPATVAGLAHACWRRIHRKVFPYDVMEVQGAGRAWLLARKLTRAAHPVSNDGDGVVLQHEKGW
jgi:hypothetical protein